MQVVSVFFILTFLFVRDGFRVFFRTIFFAVRVVVGTTMSYIYCQVFEMFFMCLVRFFRRELRAFRVEYVLFCIRCYSVFVASAWLSVMTQGGLVIARVILFRARGYYIVVNLKMAVTFVSTCLCIFYVLF